MKMAELTKPLEIKQVTQEKIYLHPFFNFIILSQENTEDSYDVICLELSTIDKLIDTLQKLKRSSLN